MGKIPIDSDRRQRRAARNHGGGRPKIRLEDWVPRHSILGRIVHPLFEERRTLAGRMSWIGLFILIAFLILWHAHTRIYQFEAEYKAAKRSLTKNVQARGDESGESGESGDDSGHSIGIHDSRTNQQQR